MEGHRIPLNELDALFHAEEGLVALLHEFLLEQLEGLRLSSLSSESVLLGSITVLLDDPITQLLCVIVIESAELY